MKINFCYFILSLIFFQRAFATEDFVQKLTLEESMKIAVENATNILKTKSNLELTGINLIKSYAQFLPNLTTQENYTYYKGNTYYITGSPALVSTSNSQASLSVSSDLNLFNGFSDYASLKSSLLNKNSTEFTLDYAKQQIALDVAQSFLQVILDEKLKNIADENLKKSRTREKLLTAQNRLGAKSLADMYLQQAATSSDESDLLNAQNKMQTDTLLLQQKLRLDVKNNIQLIEPKQSEEEKKSPYESELTLIDSALSHRPDLKAVKTAFGASEWDIRNAKSGYLPKLDFIAMATTSDAYMYSQTLNGNNVVPTSQDNMGNQLNNQVHYSFGLNLSWNIFDRLVTYNTASQFVSQSYKLKLDLEDKQNQVAEEVRQACGDYQLSLAQLKSTKKGLFASEKAYQVMSARYRLGASSILDLMTSQDSLVQAQSARAQALINYELQKWNMKKALGKLVVE